jgi:hypothetical protein
MPHAISNESMVLTFQDDGTLLAENRLSGVTRTWRWPAFRLSLRGEIIEGDAFALDNMTVDEHEVRTDLRHETMSLTAQVRYSLAEGEPWFRKQITLTAPTGTPTPDRVWMDVQEAPELVRRVGYGVRGLDGEVEGLQTYANQYGCGYPVYAGDWFIGLENPNGFALPTEGKLELYQHPTWDADGTLTSFLAVFGVAASHETVPEAFMDYLWRIRRPRLENPLTHITVGWSSRYIGDHEYIDTFEGRDAFVKALLDLNLRPQAVGIDAGWFERASMYHGKDDDEKDSRLLAFADMLRAHGLDLAIWISHNGPVGFDMDWIKQQGWEIGEGASSTYSYGKYVVMMQPDFEEALTRRLEQLVRDIGAVHLKMDWDNECASNEKFAERYPTIDHVREETTNAFFRIGARLHAANPNVKLRHGWWPSPWWLTYSDHVWLVDSGDCEYEAWPSRTARDRDATHRDMMYYHLQRTSETPVPLDAYDNHGFAQALCNCFTTEPHTWLNTCVLSALRGTTYIHYPFTPEGLRDWQAETFQQVLDWWDFHADELGQKGTRIILGRPWEGEIYGFWHPHARGGWLMLRNPSVEPQAVTLPLSELLEPLEGPAISRPAVRQVFPYHKQLPEPWELWLTGHEVAVLEVSREQLPDPFAALGAEVMLKATPDGRRAFLPATQQPTVHPDMQIPELWAEALPEAEIEGGRRLQWFVGVPHRTEHAELLVTLRGPEAVLDGLDVRAGTSRYRGDVIRDFSPVTRIFRGTRGHGGQRVLPPLGPRDRDDYVIAVPDGGYTGLTVEITGPEAAQVGVEACLTGYEGLSREGVPVELNEPLLPAHPYGFPRFLKLP